MATPLTALGSLLTNIMARTDSAPFNTPVDTVSVKDYTTVVSSPIDLGTIAANLHDYTHYNALAADIQRVFTNCMLYNAAGSDYHTLAAAHLERFEVCRARIQAVAPREEGGVEYARPDTAKEVSAKATLTGRIFALTPNDLGEEELLSNHVLALRHSRLSITFPCLLLTQSSSSSQADCWRSWTR